MDAGKRLKTPVSETKKVMHSKSNSYSIKICVYHSNIFYRGV